ncbi:MAG: type II toxin-antitoxin system Phd/YefM family antitoxin [Prochlorococcaceae cyanobacterium]
MHAVSVSGLKHNPAEALRKARSGPMVVLNRNNPDAVLIGLEQGGVLQAPGVHAALASSPQVLLPIDERAGRDRPGP